MSPNKRLIQGPFQTCRRIINKRGEINAVVGILLRHALFPITGLTLYRVILYRESLTGSEKKE